MRKYEQVVENFSCDVDTTYETVSGNQAKVTHKIGKVQTFKLRNPPHLFRVLHAPFP